MLANREQEIVVFKKLNPKDITITPFKTYKEWNITTETTASLGITFKDTSFDKTIGIECKYDKVTISENHLNYIGIKRSFYDMDKFNPYLTIGSIGEFEQTRELNGKIQILSIPQQVFGERIKPGSVILYQGNGEKTYYDDSKGNLYYPEYTSSIINPNSLVTCINFNEYYNKFTNEIYSGSIKDDWNYRNVINGNHINFDNGIYGTAVTLQNVGSSTSSYISIKNSDELNFSIYDDYAISFWIKIPNIHSNGTFDIISKFGNNENSGYPYRIVLDTNNNVRFYLSDNTSKTMITSSITMNDDTYHHIVCTRSGSIINTDNHYFSGGTLYPQINAVSGSKMFLYVDGTLQSSASVDHLSGIYNTSDIFIGTNGMTSSFLSASLDEIRIYKRGISQNEVTGLYTTINNSAKVGNIFYEYGKIIITHPSESFQTIYPDFNLFFKGQHTIYEREIICTIRDTEFNYSMNKSLRLTENQHDDRLKSFATGSDFSPYITTVGLYNDSMQLLAVAKMGRPIRSEKNSDINIIIRLDM